MKGQGRELKEGSGSNPTENVNTQLVTVLGQMVEYFKAS